MSSLPRDMADLLEALAADQIRAYEPSLLLLADPQGNVIAADDAGNGLDPRQIDAVAADFARRLENERSCHFETVCDVGPQLALGTRIPDGRRWKILGCLVRPDATSAECPAPIAPVDALCGAFAWTAIHNKFANTRLRTRIRHLLAERDTLKASHAQAITEIIVEREKQRRQHEEKRALEELVQATKAANRAKSQFLANASHELRTPLTAILGYTDLLGDARLSEEQRSRHLTTIRRNGHLLLELINDILDLSRIEAGKMAIQRKDCVPWQIVEDLVSLMQVRAAEKDLRLEACYEFPIPRTIRTDSVRLRQILINLLGNAIKFTEQGSVQITVRCVRPAEAAPRMEFAVSDTGTGIAPEQIGRLFEPFTQGDTSASRHFGGTGLGLAISQRLARMLGGHVAVTSQLGRGSTFTVSIDPGPLNEIPMLHALPGPAAERPAGRREAADWRLCGRVLFVEDCTDNQRLIGLLLRNAGLEVDLAENGQAALERVAAAGDEGRPYALILMDMQMPTMDGYEATRRLREDGWHGPIVALTAHAMAGDREKCLEAGCDDYVSKPVERTVFLSTVSRYLDRAQPAPAAS